MITQKTYPANLGSVNKGFSPFCFCLNASREHVGRFPRQVLRPPGGFVTLHES